MSGAADSTRSCQPPPYAELHCLSNFTFLRGASHPQELVAQAAALGYRALALTDECSLSGVVRAHVAAKEHGLHLIIGAELRLACGLRLVALATDRQGYGRLCRLITLGRRAAHKGSYHLTREDLVATLERCLLLWLPGERPQAEQAHWLVGQFPGAVWIAAELLRDGADRARLEALRRIGRTTALPLVASGDVHMHVRARRRLQDALTAVRLNVPVAEAGWNLYPNGERYLREPERLAKLYPPELIAETARIAARCTFSLDELRYEYPRELVPAGETPASHLRRLTEAGAQRRWLQGVPPAERAALEHELALIAELGYEPYFLTVHDLVDFARRRGIFCQGRGSAANSRVCYCLGVTAVDPQRGAGLLFERFISRERNEPPDIDIDFEHQRREEVIQYIYRKYGRERAALTAVVISYRPRSALRDVGRALGIDAHRIAAVAKSQHWFDGRTIDPERLRENGFDPAARLTQLWVSLTEALIGFPRHLSQHPGGFVIARDDLAELVPVENTAMERRTVIQWDKDDLDTLGLLKVDILALGMLSAIRRGLELVGAKQRWPIALHQVPKEDPAVYRMLGRGDSVGVFQVESRAQMSMLPRLRPHCFYDLVIEVAIVRPGPIQGGMVHPYLRRRNGQEPVDIPSQELEPALARTLGVPIFQEQVMQIAIHAADFTPGEADALRRAMAAWKRKGGLGPFRQRLVGRMVEKGYARDFAERIFQQMEGFGDYGFPESHAASFALLVYASAWIKCHHPDAFLAALLNSQPMGFYAPAQLVRDARAHGVVVKPVDLLRSEWDSVLEAEGEGEESVGAGPACALRAVRLGFGRIAGFGEAAARRVVAARAQGPFSGPEDLARRAQLDAGELALLAQADALLPLAGHRHQAAWAVAGVDTRATPLLRATRTHEAGAALPAPAPAATVLADYRATGLSLTQHPVGLLRGQLAAFRVQPAAVLAGYPSGRLARASGLVTHRQRPETARGVIFVTLEDETGAVNVIVWPQVALAQRRALLASTLLTVYGIWQREGDGEHAVRHLVARTLVDHTALLQGLSSRSRDFH